MLIDRPTVPGEFECSIDMVIGTDRGLCWGLVEVGPSAVVQAMSPRQRPTVGLGPSHPGNRWSRAVLGLRRFRAVTTTASKGLRTIIAKWPVNYGMMV